MGNICRSPTAEGVLRHRVAEIDEVLDIRIDSAGTHGYHAGSPPDPRAVSAAARRGIDISGQRARAVEVADFHRFDLILAMDRSHLTQLMEICPLGHENKISLLLSHDPGASLEDVPDPYYGSYEGFVEVFQIIERAVVNVMTHIGKSGA